MVERNVFLSQRYVVEFGTESDAGHGDVTLRAWHGAREGVIGF